MEKTIVAKFKGLKVGDQVILNTRPPRLTEITRVTRTTVFSGDMGFDIFTGTSTSKRWKEVHIELATPENLAAMETAIEKHQARAWVDQTRTHLKDRRMPIDLLAVFMREASAFVEKGIVERLWSMSDEEAVAVWKAYQALEGK